MSIYAISAKQCIQLVCKQNINYINSVNDIVIGVPQNRLITVWNLQSANNDIECKIINGKSIELSTSENYHMATNNKIVAIAEYKDKHLEALRPAPIQMPIPLTPTLSDDESSVLSKIKNLRSTIKEVKSPQDSLNQIRTSYLNMDLFKYTDKSKPQSRQTNSRANTQLSLSRNKSNEKDPCLMSPKIYLRRNQLLKDIAGKIIANNNEIVKSMLVKWTIISYKYQATIKAFQTLHIMMERNLHKRKKDILNTFKERVQQHRQSPRNKVIQTNLNIVHENAYIIHGFTKLSAFVCKHKFQLFIDAYYKLVDYTLQFPQDIDLLQNYLPKAIEEEKADAPGIKKNNSMDHCDSPLQYELRPMPFENQPNNTGPLAMSTGSKKTLSRTINEQCFKKGKQGLSIGSQSSIKDSKIAKLLNDLSPKSDCKRLTNGIDYIKHNALNVKQNAKKGSFSKQKEEESARQSLKNSGTK